VFLTVDNDDVFALIFVRIGVVVFVVVRLYELGDYATLAAFQ